MKGLIVKYFSGELTKNQKDEFFEQLSVDPETQKEFTDLQNTIALASLSTTKSDTEIAEIYFEDFKKKRKWKTLRVYLSSFSKYAAVLAFGFLVCYYTINQTTGSETDNYSFISVPAGQRVKLTLQDGTTVWLNSRSTLSYPGVFSGKTREVILDGEAYFDVTSNKEKAFIVKTQKLDIRVFGTEFNVMDYSGNPLSEVSLLKGSVEVKTTGNSQAYTMKENEKISLRNDRLTVENIDPHSKNEISGPDDPKIKPISKINTGNNKLFVSQIKNYEYFKWKDGLICFNNEPVEDILNKLELFYDIRIEVMNPQLLKQRYSGKFRTKDGIEQVIKVLQLEHKFSYTRDNDLNLITIKK